MNQTILYCGTCGSYTPMHQIICGAKMWWQCDVCKAHKPRNSKQEQFHLYAFSCLVMLAGVGAFYVMNGLESLAR